MKKRFRLLAGTLALLLALSGCGQTAANGSSGSGSAQNTVSDNTQSDGTLDVLRVGLAALPTQLDPDYSIGIASIKLFYNIFDTLLFTDKEGNISGQLAESWEWVVDAGMIGGKPGNILDPAGTATRAEVATILRNFHQTFEA